MAETKKRKSGRPDTPVTVELVKHTYQPTKAELEEEFPVDVSFEELTKAMVQPIKVRWIDRPRKRR